MNNSAGQGRPTWLLVLTTAVLIVHAALDAVAEYLRHVR